MKRWWLFSAMFFKLIDVVSTYFSVAAKICREINPIVIWVIDRIGLGWTMIANGLLSFVLLFWLYDRCVVTKKYLPLYIITVVLFGVVVNNIFRIIQRGFYAPY